MRFSGSWTRSCLPVCISPRRLHLMARGSNASFEGFESVSTADRAQAAALKKLLSGHLYQKHVIIIALKLHNFH
jgi:hypothetical protein